MKPHEALKLFSQVVHKRVISRGFICSQYHLVAKECKTSRYITDVPDVVCDTLYFAPLRARNNGEEKIYFHIDLLYEYNVYFLVVYNDCITYRVSLSLSCWLHRNNKQNYQSIKQPKLTSITTTHFEGIPWVYIAVKMLRQDSNRLLNHSGGSEASDVIYDVIGLK